MVKVEVVYCGIATSFHRYLTVEPGATVAEVIGQSGVYLSHPEARSLAVGIFSKLVAMDTLVQAGDRIELYRPLQIDPKENRRQRARQQKS